jgi:hypothetical protein
MAKSKHRKKHSEKLEGRKRVIKMFRTLQAANAPVPTEQELAAAIQKDETARIQDAMTVGDSCDSVNEDGVALDFGQAKS